MKDLRIYSQRNQEDLDWIYLFLRKVDRNSLSPKIEEMLRDFKICNRRIELYYKKKKNDQQLYDDIDNQCQSVKIEFDKLKERYMYLFGVDG